MEESTQNKGEVQVENYKKYILNYINNIKHY